MVKFSLKGVDDVVKGLSRLDEQTKHAVKKSLVASGFIVQGAARVKIVEVGAVDTGTMKNSVQVSEPFEQGRALVVEVGPTVEYAIFVEMGTYKMAARPFMRPALVGSQSEIIDIITKALRRGLWLRRL